MPRFEGHKAGVENLHAVLEHLNNYGIKYVTVYTFSTENWSRPEDEVNGLFQLAEAKIESDLPQFQKMRIRLRHLGRLQGLPRSLKQVLTRAVEETRNNTGMTLSLAFNYGGRAEILDAVRAVMAKGVPPQRIDEKLFSKYLYTAGLPEVDLLIRTANELRLSNFLIWQTAYSEYYFTRVLWPDFGKKEIDKALLAYSQRQRRFGGL